MNSAARMKHTMPNVLPALRTFMVGVFLAIQTFLLVHQFEHGLRPDLAAASDDCVVCQASANLLPAPAPAAVLVPVVVVPVVVIPALAQTATPRADLAGFRSRAPPLSVSA